MGHLIQPLFYPTLAPMYDNNLLFRLKLALALGNIIIHDCDNKVSNFLQRKNKLNLPELTRFDPEKRQPDRKTESGCNALTVGASFPFLTNLISLPSGLTDIDLVIASTSTSLLLSLYSIPVNH